MGIRLRQSIFVAVLALLTSFARAEGGSAFVLAQPIGLGVSFASVTAIAGVSLGYNLTDSSFMSFDYSHIHSPLASDYSTKTKGDSFGIDYGYYLTESFFVRGGPRVKSEIVSQHQYSSEPYRSGEATRYELKAAIGNMWSSPPFLVGADWLTVAIPLHTSVGANPQNRDFESRSLEFAKLWLGASF